MPLESTFKRKVKEELQMMFPGCVLMNLDPNTIFQGVPDLLILWNEKWALLEFKRSSTARRQPNQGYYVDMFDKMSFSAFIRPENKEEVLRDLEHAFRDR